MDRPTERESQFNRGIDTCIEELQAAVADLEFNASRSEGFAHHIFLMRARCYQHAIDLFSDLKVPHAVERAEIDRLRNLLSE